MDGLSPRLYLERCDEDIDLLSELLGANSDESYEDTIDVSDDAVDCEIDELTSYLGRNSNSKSPSPAPHDPFMSPSTPRPNNDLALSESPPPKQSHPLVNTNSKSEIPDSTGSEHADENTKPKTIVLYIPPKEIVANKSALAARENRKKKKMYVEQLETDVDKLNTENTELKMKVSSQDETIENLSEQVKYLQSVITNQSTLSALLNNIENTSGVKLKSSWSTKRKLSEVCPVNPTCESRQNQANKPNLRKSKRKCELESESISLSKRVRREKENSSGNSESDLCFDGQERFSQFGSVAGVCLHVSGSEVSLEFCVKCSQMAASSQVQDEHSYVRSTSS